MSLREGFDVDWSTANLSVGIRRGFESLVAANLADAFDSLERAWTINVLENATDRSQAALCAAGGAHFQPETRTKTLMNRLTVDTPK
jgi:hypothetical protein